MCQICKYERMKIQKHVGEHTGHGKRAFLGLFHTSNSVLMLKEVIAIHIVGGVIIVRPIPKSSHGNQSFYFIGYALYPHIKNKLTRRGKTIYLEKVSDSVDLRKLKEEEIQTPAIILQDL